MDRNSFLVNPTVVTCSSIPYPLVHLFRILENDQGLYSAITAGVAFISHCFYLLALQTRR